MSFVSRKTLTEKLLRSKKFRDSYVFENLKRIIPFQVRGMRDERDWSQAQAGQALGKPQNVVSRLESPAYGKLTLQTLLEIAHGFDVGLLIKFVPFSRLVREYDDVSIPALSAKSVTDKDESNQLEKWALEENPQAVDKKQSAYAEAYSGPKLISKSKNEIRQDTLSFERNLKLLDKPSDEDSLVRHTSEVSRVRVEPLSVGVTHKTGTTGTSDLVLDT